MSVSAHVRGLTSFKMLYNMTPMARFAVFFVFATSAGVLAFLPGFQAVGFQAVGCKCPPLWTAFQNHCYRYFSVKNITWLDAEMHCSGFSVPCTDVDSNISLGHLVSIHSNEEMDFLRVLCDDLRSKVVSDYPRVWIGLNDKTTEGTWEWSDGSRFDYENWESGQPNNAGEQDCVEFHSREGEFIWNDLWCDTEGRELSTRAYVCKLPQW